MGQYKGPQQLKCQYIIVTLIYNLLTSSWDNMLSTLNRVFTFCRQTFQNIQIVVTFNYIDHHSSL